MSDFDPKTDVLNNAINEPGWTILDIRNDNELVDDGNLRDLGAKNWLHIPTPELTQALELAPEEFKAKYNAEPLSKESNIVVHCKGGGRSARMTPVLVEAGYKAVDYPGGILKWKEHFTASTLPS